MICLPEKYNLSKDSLFLDIGSGFGKPVFHTAFQVNCECLGIEVVPARSEFCLDFFYEYLCNKNIFTEPEFEKKDKINISSSCTRSIISNHDDKKLEKVKLFMCQKGLIESYILESKTFFETTINNNFIKDGNLESFIENKPKCIFVDTFKNDFEEYFQNSEIEFEKDSNYNYLEENFLCEDNLKLIKNVENVKILDFFNFKSEFVDFVKENECFNSLLLKFTTPSTTNNTDQIKVTTKNNYNSVVHNNFKKKSLKNKKILSKKDKIKKKKLAKIEDQNSDEDLTIKKHILSSYIVSVSPAEIKLALSTLSYRYDINWWSKANFECEDATNMKIFSNDKNEHCTHIYSYNKIMSDDCRYKVAKILNKTNFKVLAWYLTPKQTEKIGLRNCLYLCSFTMQTTSTEKFNVYIYIKTK